ncbi:hypothetical protein HK099_001300 [Clydaea vesicula]|uniref:Dihydrolipoamide acetyltransferase component of pyruvate dehydrogenase complex n=1 Tax=Clydaea vesicula TaxID=447962 RepID=A0AAD5U560_9FUNG|nr:hypothetical protein HK099_001300 [Clydaea vesicula]KAJ3392063.1 hypothetical protein HDU92_008661 [Lobulomyces angularis]
MINLSKFLKRSASCGSFKTSTVKYFHTSSSLFKIEQFKLADIGEGIAECELIKWFVKEGDEISQFDKICEVQSDKAAVEISSRFDGKVVKLCHKLGDMAKVGSTLVEIDTGDEDVAVEEAATEKIVENKNMQQIQTPTPKTDIILEDFSNAHKKSNHLIFTTPAVRRISRENNVDLSLVKGSGKDGRIMKEDVLSFIQHGAKSTPSIPQEGLKGIAATTGAATPLTQIQKAMFRQMTKSLSIPHFGFSEEIILNESIKIRNSLNEYIKFENKANKNAANLKDLKITFMAIFLKAMSKSLLSFPILNSGLVFESGDLSKPLLQYRDYHNIGIAMDTPQGLIVPNIKNVETKSIIEIAIELNRLKNLSAQEKLTPKDFQQTTITFSNIGNVGGTWLHPVITEGQVCIGSVGKVQKLPRFNKDGVVVSQDILCTSWNADHRVVDGATLARFVTKWKGYLEQPAWLLT